MKSSRMIEGELSIDIGVVVLQYYMRNALLCADFTIPVYHVM
jgi:hypothetical protein